MKIGLFVPCYIDQFYPRVGIATLNLLENLGLEASYPLGATCCGQPMANSGCVRDALPSMRLFVDTYAPFDYVVMPSGSCTLQVRHHFDALEQSDTVQRVRKRTYELCEFLVDILGRDDFGAHFPHKVGLHQSCHGQRGLRLSQSSELNLPPFSKLRRLLSKVNALELMELDRPDECCGFGGAFAVDQAALSVKMGRDRLSDHLRHGVEVITAADMSCLMHLEGIIRRQKLTLRVMHIAEILANN
jgi:L-lactate dehydrogenase complex protein LldE